MTQIFVINIVDTNTLLQLFVIWLLKSIDWFFDNIYW